MNSKFALIIGNNEYNDPRLARLVTPSKDAIGLANILASPSIGEFDKVDLLLNQPEGHLRRAIDRFYAQRKKDDLLLLYFSGHGVLDDQGLLYFAVKDTEHDALRSTAISAGFVRQAMDRSNSRRQILILDCCNYGAFARGTKGLPGSTVGTAAAFEVTGYGRVVLTATDATQFAWEGDQVIGQAENSVFTHFLIQGLQTGAADRDGDGQVTIDEWYNYVHYQVLQATSKQTPLKFADQQRGHIAIAKNPFLNIDRRMKQTQGTERPLHNQSQQPPTYSPQIQNNKDSALPQTYLVEIRQAIQDVERIIYNGENDINVALVSRDFQKWKGQSINVVKKVFNENEALQFSALSPPETSRGKLPRLIIEAKLCHRYLKSLLERLIAQDDASSR